MITYLIEVSICWLLFYSIYLLLLRKETFFTINRWYLLSTLGLGLLIPLFTVEFAAVFYEEPTNSVVYLAEGFSELEYVIEASVEEAKGIEYSWLTLVTLLYILGVIAAFVRFLYGFRQICSLYKAGTIIKKGNYNLVVTQTPHLPFSFFNYLFWNEGMALEDKDSGKIITHELAHINQWHSLDVLFLEFLGIALWFSPPIYWYKKSLRTVHEYLADAYVLRDTKKKQYGQLLIRQVQSGMQVALANNFIHSQLKQRINMMTRNKSRRKALTRYLPALPLLLLMVLVFSNKNVQQNFNETTAKASLAFEELSPEVLKALVATEDVRFLGDFDPVKVKAKMRIAYRDGSIGWFTEDGKTMDSDTQKMKELDRESKRLIAKYPDKESTIIMLTMEVATENGYSLHYVGESMRYRAIKNFKKGEEIKMEIDKENLNLPLFSNDKDKIRTFIYENINWPTIVEEKEIYGLINTSFLIRKDGSMINIKIKSDLDKSVNEEVRRVLKLMQIEPTKWSPAKIDGKAVDMVYDLPFNIRQEGYGDSGIWFDKGEKTKEGLTWNYFSGINKESTKGKKESNFEAIDKKPHFSGGEKELLKFIYTNIKYPVEARNKGVYGEMIVQFGIEKDGNMSNLKVKNDLGGGLKEEVLRVMKMVQEMPVKWTPATKNGEAVRSTYELPFEYHLEDENGDSPSFTKTHKGIHIVIIGRTKAINKEKKADAVYKEVDEMPRFPGCEDKTGTKEAINTCAQQEMLQFIYSNIKYPAAARKAKIEGTVVARFIVDKKGQINKIEIVRSIGGDTDAEVLSTIEKMPNWIPGKKDGKVVSVIYNLPVKFRLEKDAKPIQSQRPKIPKETMDGEPIYKVAEVMPRFPGCEGEEGDNTTLKNCADMKMLEFIFKHVKYPAEARKKGTEGVAVVRFLVEKDGTISDAELLRNPGEGTGEEALRVVNLMAEQNIKWTPGLQDGKPVNVNFVLPVKFKLAEDAKAAIREAAEAEKATEQPKDLLKWGSPAENVTFNLSGNSLILNAFPNPAREKLTVTLEGKAKNIVLTVFDATGKEYFRKQIQAFDGQSYETIDLSNAPKGTLIVNVRHKGKDYQKKVIVQ